MSFVKSLKRISIVLGFIFLLFVSFDSSIVFAQGAQTPGVGQTSTGPIDTGITYDCTLDANGNLIPGKKPGDCSFEDFIAAIDKIINAGIILALAFSVVVIAYAGFIYLKSGGSASERGRANKMFRSVGIGIFFILAAWLIVNLITKALLTPEALQYVPIK